MVHWLEWRLDLKSELKWELWKAFLLKVELLVEKWEKLLLARLLVHLMVHWKEPP